MTMAKNANPLEEVHASSESETFDVRFYGKLREDIMIYDLKNLHLLYA